MDRHEDITLPHKVAEDPTCDRSVTFYGYVRGSNLKPGTKMHLIGAGDFSMTELSALTDPCPLPSKEKKSQSLNKKESLLYAPLSNVGAVSFDKDAVYIDIGRVNYTKKENLAQAEREGDEISSESESEDDGAPASLLKNLQDVQAGVDEKMQRSALRLFKSSEAVHADEHGSDSEPVTSDDDDRKRISRSTIEELAKPFRKRAVEQNDEVDGYDSDSFYSDDTDDDSSNGDSDDGSSNNDSESDDSDEEEEGLGIDDDKDEGSSNEGEDKKAGTEPSSALWKSNLAQRAAEAYIGRELSHINLQELIYGNGVSNIVSDEGNLASDAEDADGGNDSDSDDEFFKIRKTEAEMQSGSSLNDVSQSDAKLLGEEDSSRMIRGNNNGFDISVWLEEGSDSLIESIRDQFVTGNWDAKGGSGDHDDDEEFVDFDDLETGEKFGPNGEVDSDNDSDEDIDIEGMTDEQIRHLNAQKKSSKKNNFDDEYDEGKKMAGISADPNDEAAESAYIDSLKRAKEARLKRNKEEFGEDGEAARIRHEGFRQGLYCRIRIDGVPCEFIDSFNPELPVVLGGLTPQETNRGFIRCRFKKHRWHKRILKCNDPLIFSVGWRRFQSIPVFSTEDENGRHR